MNYLNIDFPSELLGCFGCSIDFSTSIAMLKNKTELRYSNWQEPRYKYSLIYKNCSEKNFQKLKSFFLLCKGKKYSFNFLDINDNKIINQPIAQGNGNTSKFEIYKLYSYEDLSYKRKIYKTFKETVYINNEKINETKYKISNGVISFTTPPKQNDMISIDCNFYIIARFDIDCLPIINKSNLIELPEISLIESKDLL